MKGERWVVDMDLEKFFDRVNHDVLMARVARRVGDERVLKLIRRYLEAGMMADGLVQPRRGRNAARRTAVAAAVEHLADRLDRELERRGLCILRYADDCNVYVRSRRAGNESWPHQGFLDADLQLTSMKPRAPWRGRGSASSWATASRRTGQPAPHRPAKHQANARGIKELLRQGRGRSLAHDHRDLNPVLRGWINYFPLTQTKRRIEELDTWVRRQLRRLLWRQWKRPKTRESMRRWA